MIESEITDFLFKWKNIPFDLIGNIFDTEQELLDNFPSKTIFEQASSIGSIGDLSCDIYAVKSKLDKILDYFVGYKCNYCEKSIIGMPDRIKGIYYCHRCKYSFGTF